MITLAGAVLAFICIVVLFVPITTGLIVYHAYHKDMTAMDNTLKNFFKCSCLFMVGCIVIVHLKGMM